jgi:hypothetical protein
MVALNYDAYEVLVMFRLNGGPVNPTLVQIAVFDATLFAENEKMLLEIMPEEGIETSKGTKSTVFLYSRFGEGTNYQRIRNACIYFKNTCNLDKIRAALLDQGLEHWDSGEAER